LKELIEIQKNEKIKTNKYIEQKLFYLRIPEKKKIYKLNKSKIKKRLFAYFNLNESKKNIYFYTITFPLNTTDNDCYKFLNLWLTKVRYKYRLFTYLWICERQLKNTWNSTIHYHLCTNSKINIGIVNGFMREILENIYSKNNNYFHTIDKLNNKIVKGYNPNKYNGIDICKDRVTKKIINFSDPKNKKKLTNYLTKYITKNETEFYRIVWHCSHVISKLFCSGVINKFDTENFEFLSEKKGIWQHEEKFFKVKILDKCYNIELMNELFYVNNFIYQEWINEQQKKNNEITREI